MKVEDAFEKLDQLKRKYVELEILDDIIVNSISNDEGLSICLHSEPNNGIGLLAQIMQSNDDSIRLKVNGDDFISIAQVLKVQLETEIHDLENELKGQTIEL